MSEYPEHDKLQAVVGESQTIGEFLEWLPQQGFRIAERDPETDRYYPAHVAIEKLLARFFGIDLDALETEKRQMLGSIRAMHSAPSSPVEGTTTTEADQ